ncbi:unnamed protein product, partial [Menidia menidia]
MDWMDLRNTNSGCDGKNCGLASTLPDDCSNEDCYWEEPMFGQIELVCVTVIYIPLMLFGLLGNILTILVVWLRPHMRSSTYLYLSSMAVSDLLILLLLPLDLYKLWRPRPWILGDLACKMTMFLSECCTFCTILHITFLSLERYLAVCWPITAKTLVTRRRTRAIIGCLWLGAAVSAAPVLVMVGVEEVGGEEFGFSQWREEGGWMGMDGEQGGLMVGEGERGSAQIALVDPGLDGIKFGGKQTEDWSEGVGELLLEDKREGMPSEAKKDIDKLKDEKGAGQEGSEEEVKMVFEGDHQNKMKEDEGGGREGNFYGGRERRIDRRECRCTHYAISSGLLSAMMILSNLYFLIPLCILGLVYSLIGRTLWLRPKSSRRDQSHRNTVKMLGVIVLAFVLCWLPFHVGRTIFSLSLGTGSEKQEISTETNSHFKIDMLTDVSADSKDINTHSASRPTSRSDSDAHFSEAPHPGRRMVHTLAEANKRVCDMCVEPKDISTHSSHVGTDKQVTSYTITQTELQNTNIDTSTQNMDPRTEESSHKETHDNSANVNTKHGKCSPDINTKVPVHNSTNNRRDRVIISVKSQNVTSTHTHFPIPNTAAPTDLYTETPNVTQYNDTLTQPDTNMYFLYYLSQYFNLVSSVLFYLSAAVNPLLYNLMSARYRLAVHSLIHKNSHAQPHRLRTLTAQHSTTTL